MTALSVLDRIPPRATLTAGAVVRVAMLPGDEPLVNAGDVVAPGDGLLRRPRHPQVGEQPLHGRPAPSPGTRFTDGRSLAGQGRRAARFEGGGEVLYVTPAGRLRVVVSRNQAVVECPVAGTIEALDACSLTIRVEGTAIRAALTVGEASHGSLVVAVPGPDAELHPQSIDVRHAGAVLVAGSRVDVESLTRARAMGVRGVIVGGVIGSDVRALRASIERQEASVHASPAFALVVLDGYGKRPIPRDAWDALTLAAGAVVGVATDPPLVALPASVVLPVAEPGRVRVTAGSLLGRTGRVVEPSGCRRQAGGIYQDCARVELDPATFPAGPEVVDVPLADLERDD
jgi:hypothetical protein